MSTDIEWCDETINPVIGCQKLSAGCTNCYAVRMAHRLGANPKTPQYKGLTRNANTWTGETRLVENELRKPFGWKKPRRIFVGSMTDLFHEATPDGWIDDVFAMMAMCPQHTFQILTKRPARMQSYFAARKDGDPWAEAADHIADLAGIEDHPFVLEPKHIPLGNVWMGVTVEDQSAANERIPLLLKTPAAKRFISAEPLLSRLDLSGDRKELASISWVICGAETGPKRRPMDQAWARGLRDQCVSAGVPFFLKKLSDGSRELDGQVWEQFPGARKAVAA